MTFGWIGLRVSYKTCSRSEPAPRPDRGRSRCSGLCAGSCWFRRALRRFAPWRGSTGGSAAQPAVTRLNRRDRWLSHVGRGAVDIGRNPREVRREPVPRARRGVRLRSGVLVGAGWFDARRVASRLGAAQPMVGGRCGASRLGAAQPAGARLNPRSAGVAALRALARLNRRGAGIGSPHVPVA